MARNLDPKCKQCRRVGEKLFLKGERCFTPKCPIVKRNYPPGQHGLKGKTRISSYGLHLREKQKVKKMYRLLERQFAQYLHTALEKEGNTAELFLQALELRLDNVVYQLGLASSRDQARQLVNHGHIHVNSRVVTIPSFALRVGDTVSIPESARTGTYFANVQKTIGQHKVPSWLHLDPATLQGRVDHVPVGDELNQGLQVQLIVEYYAQ